MKSLLNRLSLAQQFMLASLAILLAGMLIIGWWIGHQIEAGVVSQTAAVTALYVDSFVSPHLQDLGRGGTLGPEHLAALDDLLWRTPLGQRIVAFKVWDAQGRILYSTSPRMIGRVFPVRGNLARAWNGEVASKISDLRDAENAAERERWDHLLETYAPVRQAGTDRVIAVAEFYQTVDGLQNEILAAQMQSWLIVIVCSMAMYVLLAGMVKRGSDTIARQQAELRDKVAQLTQLLEQNELLRQRLARAAARTTALNERFLRRISAELHDGPAQDLGLALLRLDSVMANCATDLTGLGDLSGLINQDLNTIQTSLQRALGEVRAISAGLRLPELDDLTPAETLARVVRVHERRTDTKVTLSLDGLPEQAPLPVKITLYRLIQEALSNAYRHGGGAGQQVRVGYEGDQLSIEVSDEGPGFDWAQIADQDDPLTGSGLGLAGMRERVESLGGLFRIETQSGQGTRVIARLPLHPMEGNYEG